MDAYTAKSSDLLVKLRDLAPAIAAAGPAMDAEGRLPRALVAALAEAGLFRLWLPRAPGGFELSPFEFMEVVEAAAALDGSVGWLVGNGGGASRVGGYIPEAAARTYFDAPGSFLVLGTGGLGRAEPTPGGYQVTGRWPYGSGIHGATSVGGLCAVPGEGSGPARLLVCLAPIASARVVDGWDVSGLRGTGSCDWTLEDVIVPEDHAFDFPTLRPTQPGIVCRLPGVSSFTWTVSTVPLGLARACLDAFTTLAGNRMRAGTSQVLRDRETVQAEVGRAEARLRAARAFKVEAMSALMDAVERDEPDLLPYRADLRLAGAHAADTALAVAATLESAVGALAIQESGPFARRLRDLRAAVQHISVSPNNYVVGGRLLLGLDPGTSRF